MNKLHITAEKIRLQAGILDIFVYMQQKFTEWIRKNPEFTKKWINSDYESFLEWCKENSEKLKYYDLKVTKNLRVFYGMILKSLEVNLGAFGMWCSQLLRKMIPIKPAQNINDTLEDFFDAFEDSDKAIKSLKNVLSDYSKKLESNSVSLDLSEKLKDMIIKAKSVAEKTDNKKKEILFSDVQEQITRQTKSLLGKIKSVLPSPRLPEISFAVRASNDSEAENVFDKIKQIEKEIERLEMLING